MTFVGCFILLIVIVLPFAWFASESSDKRWLRLTLGSSAILASFGVAFLVGSLDRFNSNAWFGGATKNLVDATVSELERGNVQQVITSLKHLQAQYQPNYENRARYDELADQTVKQMKSTPTTTQQ